MSAIVGLWRGASGEIAPDLRRMADATSANVVQPSGRWRFLEKGAVGLGWLPGPFTPEDRADAQPLRLGRLTMVADARLDNRAELQRELKVTSARERPLSDGALLLRAFATWREGTPERLLGDFAFAVWDEADQTLFCARDHRGKRPLFYHAGPHTLAIASSPRALLALPHVPRRLNEGALADFMAFMGEPATTLFEGICRVPPGHSLTATRDGVRLGEYWRMEAQRNLRTGSDDECIERFRALFLNAVECRLRSTGPIGAFLSGGLDSSSVACVAAHLLQARGERIATFTAVPRREFRGPRVPGFYDDETPFVESIRALHGNLDATYVPPGGTTFLAGLDRSFETCGFPVTNAPNRVWFEATLERAAACGIRVLLNGTEGNLWMSYQGTSQGSRGQNLVNALRKAGPRPGARAILSIVRRYVIAPLVPRPVLSAYRRLRADAPAWAALSPMRAEFAAESGVHERYNASTLREPVRPGSNSAHRRIALATETLVAFENDFHNALRLRYGVDMRDPTADRRLIEFCLALPEDQFSRAGEHRLLVRRGMKGFLPPDVLWNRMRGRQAPDWYEGLSTVRKEIAGQLAGLERDETAVRCLDLPRMRRALGVLPAPGRTPSLAELDELMVLARGIAIGRFICWLKADRSG